MKARPVVLAAVLLVGIAPRARAQDPQQQPPPPPPPVPTQQPPPTPTPTPTPAKPADPAGAANPANAADDKNRIFGLLPNYTSVEGTTEVKPITSGESFSILKQDPRYYQGHATGFFNRLAYAASRSAVTKSRSGQPQFNLSEIGGTLIVANVGNLYYPVEERNVPDTMQRWGMQTMWVTVANELKEFWPDIRKVMHGR